MNARVVLYSSDGCFGHDTGAGHPENGKRLGTVLQGMRDAFSPQDTSNVIWKDAPLGDVHQVCLVHAREYYDDLAHTILGLTPEDAPVNVDVDTKVSDGSLDAAAYALQRDDVRKVVIVDFDVHQGNGTQDLIKDNPDILLVSLHQDDIWPYEHSEDKGVHGNILNIGVPPLSDTSFYYQAFEEKVLPMIRQWAPDLVVISAGFDAHQDDPPKGDALFNDAAGRQNLLESDFTWMTQQMLLAGAGKSVSILEGSYTPEVLARCCVSHVNALLSAG